jgi:hypothetical protein
MDVREDAILVSRSEKQNDKLEKLWEKPLPAMHPRASPVPSESNYETAPDSPNSFQTTSSEIQQASPESNTLPVEESESHRIYDGVPNSFQMTSSEIQQALPESNTLPFEESESHRIYDGVSSENYVASNEGGSGSTEFHPSDLPAEPELEPEPVDGSNPSAGGLPTTGSSAAEPESGSQKSFLRKLASKSWSYLSKLASKSKNFFGKLAAKLKFWRRTSESVSTRPRGAKRQI